MNTIIYKLINTIIFCVLSGILINKCDNECVRVCKCQNQEEFYGLCQLMIFFSFNISFQSDS